MKLLPSRRKFCVHHTMLHVTLCNLSHIGKVYACLAVTCHLHFWQHDRDILPATATTGWGTNKSVEATELPNKQARKHEARPPRINKSHLSRFK